MQDVNNMVKDILRANEEILKIPQFVYYEDSELYFKILEEEYNKLPDETNPIINDTGFYVELENLRF